MRARDDSPAGVVGRRSGEDAAGTAGVDLLAFAVHHAGDRAAEPLGARIARAIGRSRRPLLPLVFQLHPAEVAAYG
jgi:hypothetical protein